jgi:protein phosphatase
VQLQTNYNFKYNSLGSQKNFTNTPPLLTVGLAAKLPIRSFFHIRTKRKITKTKTTADEAEVSAVLFDEIGCASDVGRVRQIDEDSVLIAKIFSTYTRVPQEKVFMVIADGMGGHSKGEVASAIGVATASSLIVPKLCSQNNLDYAQELSSAVKEANAKILNYAMDHPECEGMGTTMTASIVNTQKIYVGHVGDTRAYVFAEGKIKQFTKDHSLVQNLVDKGGITADEARSHPQKNVITRVVGYYPSIEVDTYEEELQKNDQILMCCDGLVNHVKDSEIAETVLSGTDPTKACERLVSMANERGGKDNISIILTSKFKKT